MRRARSARRSWMTRHRWRLPGSDSLNFLLHHALGNGGAASLRTDPQGKAFAQMLLDFPVPIPRALVAVQ